MTESVDKDELFASLPPPWPQPLLSGIRDRLAEAGGCFAVLDDDPTGGQTLHGMPVLAAWDADSLTAEIERSAAFFLLTNSRALPEADAVALNRQAGEQLRAAATQTGRALALGSRGDSTLRGHFPAETDALFAGWSGTDRPAYLLAPYFGDGGRFTIHGVQYVQQGDRLVPAAETEFARDPTFGYRHSRLADWVEEKSGGRLRAAEVVNVTLEDLRLGGPEAVAAKLASVLEGGVAVLDAACERDLEVGVTGLLSAEAAGKRFLYRTSAAFVRVRAGIEERPPLTTGELGGPRGAGLVLVGSYVDRTSRQLEALLALKSVRPVELRVEALLGARSDAEVARVAQEATAALDAGLDAVVYSTRALTRQSGALDFLAIGRQIGAAFSRLARGLDRRPGFIVVKGGSTSHEVATNGLGLRRGLVLGQLIPGVPVWQLGPESRYPDLPYVVFPGNVGGPDALVEGLAVLHGGSDAGPR